MLRPFDQRRQTGDTLIEVLFAFTILSLVIVGALAIMNQGTQASQRSLEVTLVRQQIDSQATTLRFLHDAYVAAYQTAGTYVAGTPAKEWQTMTNGISSGSVAAFDTGATTCPAAPAGAFILDGAKAQYRTTSAYLKTASTKTNSTYAQVKYDTASGAFVESDGIWIEGVRSQPSTDPNAANTNFIDFHIRACWDNPGQGPVMNIATIVRLYEPRG